MSNSLRLPVIIKKIKKCDSINVSILICTTKHTIYCYKKYKNHVKKIVKVCLWIEYYLNLVKIHEKCQVKT